MAWGQPYNLSPTAQRYIAPKSTSTSKMLTAPITSTTSLSSGGMGGGAYDQLYNLALSQGLSPAQAATAAAIAMGESGGNPAAVGDTSLQDAKWGPSIGLWQIRSLKADYGTGRPRDASRLHDPAFNAWAMAQISGGGQNWSPWTVYKTGAYKKYLGGAAGAASAPGQFVGTSLDAYQKYVREQSKSMFPALAAAIDQGITVRQYADPYIQRTAQLLEISPEAIDLTEPKYRKFLDNVLPDGKRSAMALWEVETLLKKDPIYGYDATKGARTEAAQLSMSLAKQFGAVG